MQSETSAVFKQEWEAGTLRSGVKTVKNKPAQQLKMDLLTWVQGSNVWKSKRLGQKTGKMPKFVQDMLSELDALLYE